MNAKDAAWAECDRTLEFYVGAVRCYGFSGADDEYRKHQDAIRAYAVAAVAEARALLVEALRPLLEADREVRTLSTHLGPEHNWYSVVVTEADIRRADAALAKETP